MKKLILWKIFSLFWIFTILPIKAESQIFINEFLASNTGTIVDPDYKESADWIELYNSGNSAVNLGGYYLSDNFNDNIKWQIPSGTQIEPKGFLVIWADGYDTGLHTNFKISADGEELALFKPGDILVDSISFGLQEPNISMGRKMDGGPEWGVFLQPTPGETNSGEIFDGVVFHVPHFSILGGIYKSPLNIEITNSFDGEIRYTKDGSEPTENSSIVSGAINIDKTTIIRSCIYQENKVPGKVVTHTYFIDSDNEIGSLPIVSLASDPDNFWDAEKGIYVQDFKPEWEIPINIELFENDGSDRAGFNLTAGTKVNGLYSWQLPQKMLGIYFRKEYGEGNLEYPLLFDRDRNSYDDFALRASGSDWAYSLFRDGMTQLLTAENMDVDYQGFRACVVFINGQYMGIHNIRSKINEDFIVQNHQLGEQKVDMIENEDYVEAGSLDQYAAFEELYHKDLTVQQNYDAVAAQMDIENFTDFIVTEIYSQNTSVDHNIMAWKPQSGGKWKWILNDLDRGFFKPGSNMISFYSDRDVIPFSDLLRNDDYKHYFGKRLADHLFTTFDPELVKTSIDEFKSNIEDEVPKHILRWEGTSSKYGDPVPSMEYWYNEIEKMKSFAGNRPSALLNDLKNYGFETSEPLAVSVVPEKTGTIVFNGIEIKQSFSQGGYPKNEEIKLEGKAKSGYIFKGWQLSGTTSIIGKEEVWKYDDSGQLQDSTWVIPEFDDSSWKAGQAELGYGDDDENTVIDFGEDSRNKNITTYFRKTFSIENTEQIQILKIALKCDDGAVVYLNGTEVARENMPDGTINHSTAAVSGIGGSAESDFTIYQIDAALIKTGENIMAVELHQVNETSSDISFDLELSSSTFEGNTFVSTNLSLNYMHKGDISIKAVFESDGSCILPEEIIAEMILNKECSPYRVPDNVIITESGKLIIEPGVEIWFSDDVSLTVNGELIANGTKNESVVFRSNPDSKNHKWGILNFVNADTSILRNVVIEDASKGENPIREIAAISVFNSVLTIDGAVIENVHENPVLGRYSDVTLKNSKLHSEITGDLINLKYGKGFVDSCEFIGNDMPDTDAIDYDDIENGIIRNSLIRDFHGFNSDAIDIGEKAKNISIENMLVYNITDKGVSVGQQSSANIVNSIFVNCNLGAGLKDSSHVTIDHCTYYGNGTPIACYEKNEGDAGGNAVVTNSILSNAYDASYSSDSKSTLNISFSASDNDELPPGKNNLFADPKFKNPNLFDFSLSLESSCIGAAIKGNMGANLSGYQKFNQLFISSIAYNSDLISEVNEFIELSNTGNTAIDVSGFKFTKGITFTFPENTWIKPGEKVYTTYNINSPFWEKKSQQKYQWEDGRLADEGEIVRLETAQGIVVDQVFYNSDNSWPEVFDGEGIILKAEMLDNHFGTSWMKKNLDTIVHANEMITDQTKLTFYPNPTTGIINFSGIQNKETVVNVHNLTGACVKSQTVNATNSVVDLSELSNGIYLLQCESHTSRVILSK